VTQRPDSADSDPRRAVVTGGATRVGRAIALELARAGYRVGIHYRSSRAEAAAAVRELKIYGPSPAVFRADLSRPDEIVGLFDEVDSRLGGLDLLVNSAAVFPRHDPLEVTVAEWDAVFATNTRAPFLCAQQAARRMDAGGSIVNIADTGAFEAWPSYVPYVATKAALVSLTLGLARAWGPRIRVNAVLPGPVLLPEDASGPDEAEAAIRRTVLGRLGSPEDVAQAVLYLDRATFVTGELLRVDGGHHLK
jgi:pteridine reductase